jgi:hypothetical protein
MVGMPFAWCMTDDNENDSCLILELRALLIQAVAPG